MLKSICQRTYPCALKGPWHIDLPALFQIAVVVILLRRCYKLFYR